MLVINILTKKTQYYLIYLYYILNLLIIGIKLNQNQLYLYILSPKVLNILTFLRYNSITTLNHLCDIVVCDNLVSKNRFEVTYIFWNIFYEYRLGLKLFTNSYNSLYSITHIYKSSI